MRTLLLFCCSLALAFAAPQNSDLADAQAAVAKNPKDARALLMLAALYDRMGQFEQAEPILERAVKAAPSLATARMELALCLARLHRYKEAGAALEPVAPPKDTPQLLLEHPLD